MADKTAPKKVERLRDEVGWSKWNRAQNLIASKNLAVFNKGLTAQEAKDVNTVHTFFEDIPAGTYNLVGGGTAVKKGDNWYDASGKPLTTQGDKPIRITGVNIPQGFAAGVTNSKLKLGVDYMDLHVDKGRATGGYNEITKLVPRTDAARAALKGTSQKVPVQTVSPLIQDNDPNKLEF